MHILQSQSLTRSTAKKKGYISSSDKNILSKIAFNGFIDKGNWDEFIVPFSKLTDRKYPKNIPKTADLINTGIRVKKESDIHSNCLSLFQFESIISPGFLLHDDRPCLLLPIKESYSNDLLGNTSKQMSLIPNKHNSLLIEKAFFRTPSRANYFQKGCLVAFYVSGVPKEIIGIARVTYSEILDIEQINLSIHRQGVVSKDILNSMSDKKNQIHVFTFDNFKEFPVKVSFNLAKKEGLISNANLVTVEKLPYNKLKKLITLAYEL